MDETTTNEYSLYPPKPELPEQGNPLAKSIGSLLLFVGAGYLFFDSDLAYILLLVLVIFIHELGHFLAMKQFNYSEVKMFFIPLLGALVSGDKREISQRQRAIILLAGPVPGIVIGLVLYGLTMEQPDETVTMAANIFVFVNVFNLIPVAPLDGGKLVETLFFSSRAVLQRVFSWISVAVLAVIAWFSGTYLLLIIPAVMVMRIFRQNSDGAIKAILDADELDYNKPYEDLTNREYWMIRERLIKNNQAFKGIDGEKYVVNKRESLLINTIQGLAEKIPVLDLSAGGKGLLTGIWILFFVGPILGLGLLIYNGVPILSNHDMEVIMVNDCMDNMGADAETYPLAARTYCQCVISNVRAAYTDEELVQHRDLPDGSARDLYEEQIAPCRAEWEEVAGTVIWVDSLGTE